jgi:hypothetical protein
MTDLANKWITVRNWDKFQHYTQRNPPWIRLYTDIGDNDDFAQLPLAAQGLLVRIWCSYARSNGALSVPRVAQTMPPRYPLRHFYDNLERLNHAGFITLRASKVLAPRKKERKKENTRARAQEENPGAEEPRNGLLEPLEHVDLHAMLTTLASSSETAKGWIEGHDG